ncbi:MAG: N-formylglutamate amidohydrolase [Sphingomonadaceae bacterium]
MAKDDPAPARYIPGAPDSPLLILADHASNHVPAGIDLGVERQLLEKHVAFDIGSAALARKLAQRLRCPAILGSVSRLVVDLHRDPGEASAIPELSDGHAIPGNSALDAAERERRIERYWRPYHQFIAERIAALAPAMLVTVHSFTPRLESRPDQARPWQVGLLYNRDDRAARIALRLLVEAGIAAGDNEPYSGRALNATMNRHAESRGLPYLAIEVRNDLLVDEKGIERRAALLAPVIERSRQMLGEA